jgi:diguanylate cyclase (GGDEF)-like protein/PAS domain S-box-containing protein
VPTQWRCGPTTQSRDEANREDTLADHQRALAGESLVVEPVLEGDASQRDFEIVHAPQTDAALRESETMRTAAEQVARVGSWRWALSTHRVSWSPGMYRLFDVDPGGFHGDFAPVLNTRVHPDDREAVEQATATVARGGGPIPVEYRVVHRDGTEHVLHGDGEIEYDAAGTPIGLVGFYQDVTEQRRAEADLRRSEVKYQIVADNTYDWEWWTAPDGTYAYVSPACERVSGHSAEEFLADSDLLLAITHPDDVAMVREHLRDDVTRRTVADRLEFRIFTTAGEERVVEHLCQAVVDEDGTHLGRRGSNRDITERKRAEEEIQRQNQELLRLNERQLRVNADLLKETASLEEINASVTEIAATDDLTGLANRRTFREHMEKAVSMARRHGAALALVSLDLDGLKRVNDSAGHAAGDEVLVLFAEHLASVCRVEDVPARLGGDEFSLLLPGIDVNGARGLAERVLAGARSCDVLRQRGVTVSAGVTAWKTNDLPDDLLRRADEALYAAKHDGGDSVAAGD